MRLITPEKKVRGLGSAKEGAHHWWHQRVTAILLIPLGLWFVISLLSVSTASHADAVSWFAAPSHAMPLVILLAGLFYHLYLGAKVVLEDYIHCGAGLPASIILLRITLFTFAVVSIVAVLKLHFGVIPS